MSHRAEFRIELVLRSPFILQGLAAAAAGVDARALRDAIGRPIIPQDQVKGLLRAAFFTLVAATGENLITDDEVYRLFGRASAKREDVKPGEEQDRPERAAALFSDLTVTPWREQDRNAATITRIAIDDLTGTVKSGALQVVELVAPLGADVRFAGTIILLAEPAHFQSETRQEEAVTLFAWLAGLFDKAAKLIPAVGGCKSAGFGEVVSASVHLVEGSVLPLALPAGPACLDARRCFRVTFDRPILVDARPTAGNVFEGSAIIPGGVFKGSLARRLQLAGKNPETQGSQFGSAFAALRFGHAFPENQSGHVVHLPMPLSLIGVCPPDEGDDPTFADALMLDRRKAAMLTTELDKRKRPPLYQVDWKSAWIDKAATWLGYPDYDDPEKLPRGHTEIGENYVAAEGNLFVDIARSHVHQQKDGMLGLRGWRLAIGRNGVDETVFGQVLAALEQGLDGIGSTGACATFHPVDDDGRGNSVAPIAGYPDLWAVTLATPAVLLDPVALQREMQGALARDDVPDEPEIVFDHYARYWRDQAGAELVNFFATQRLAGHYLAVRHRLYGSTKYYPFLLTEPGSVFLLQGDLQNRLAALLTSGLPVAKLEAKTQVTWRTCPFVPENGYGEILVNAIDHAALSRGVEYA